MDIVHYNSVIHRIMKSTTIFNIIPTICVLMIMTVTSLLPPPEDDEPLSISGETSGTSDDELRGLKGQSNPLFALHNAAIKCTLVANYGIKNECSKYVECRKTGSVPSTRYCPSGKFFDHFKRLCIASRDASCKGANQIKPLTRYTCPKDGNKYVDVSSGSSGWLECANGVPMLKRCAKNEAFSPKTLTCGDKSDDKDSDEEDEDD